MRMANFCAPKMLTCATPAICDSVCANTVSAYSLSADGDSDCDDSEMNRIGKSPGLTLRKLGGVVISTGRRRWAMVSAVCTSSAAASMSRLRSNWIVILAEPVDERDVIEETPAM